MSTRGPIHCSVITPEQIVLETDATSVVFPAHDGLIGVLKNRAPLLCELGIGALKVETAGQGVRHVFVDGGFAQVVKNEVTLLTENAVEAGKIHRSEAQAALAEAQKMATDNEEALEARNKAIARAKAKLKLAQ